MTLRLALALLALPLAASPARGPDAVAVAVGAEAATAMHALWEASVAAHTELVCGLNHALLRGLLAGRGQNPDLAELAPRPGRCCVAMHAASRDEPARRHAARKIPTAGREDGP